MFGLGIGELVVLLVVAFVVLGPEELPRAMHKLGRFAAKLRRTATSWRAQSGFDDLLETREIKADLRELQKLVQGDWREPVQRALLPLEDVSCPATSENSPPHARSSQSSSSVHGGPTTLHDFDTGRQKNTNPLWSRYRSHRHNKRNAPPGGPCRSRTT